MSDNGSALLVIDAQENMFDEIMPVYQHEHILQTIGELLRRARTEGTLVVYLRHNGGPGAPDEPGTEGWEIHPALEPQPGELIIDKRFPDGFKETDLQQELEKRDINRVIVTGMQTEFCVDATARKAAELGYEVTVVADGHSTFDMKGLTAAEAIAQYNDEWAQVANVERASEIEFR